MTYKQIINEERMFECVWCKYDFKESDANFILSENPNECVCSGCMTEWADNLLWDFKRKEQDCEKLHKQLKQAEHNLAEKDKEIERLKQGIKHYQRGMFSIINTATECRNNKQWNYK